MSRVVFLVDMNAFFISCEMTRDPSLRGRPAAVAGDPKQRSGIILTANYEARKFGVKTTMTLNEALRLCPSLTLVPPDHRFYSDKSRQVMRVLEGYTPVLDQNSIDEAWLDMTGCEAIFTSPMRAAEKIMNEIKDSLGLWCSIGISENKFLSKMASEIKKPLGLTEIWLRDIQTKLWPLPVGAMYGVGGQTAAKLKGMGVYTIGDIAGYDRNALLRRFGKFGGMLHDLANGIDYSPVTPRMDDEMKSIGRSTTLPNDITDFEYARKILMALAEEVGADARKHDKKGATVQITVKYGDFKSITRQKPVTATYLTVDIIKAGTELLQKTWDPTRPVRLLGISLTGFTQQESTQLSLFDRQSTDQTEKQEKLEKAVDSIRGKFGKSTIKRASLMKEDHGKR